MLTKNQEKIIKSLHTKKGREKFGLCLVEGNKVIETAGSSIDYIFLRPDSDQFDQLITTETPQEIAAVAKVPKFSIDDIKNHPTIIVLDGVQDPGNVGSILRLCLGFNAALILVESADVTSPKAIRSSVGAMFQVPWIKMGRNNVDSLINKLKRPVYRLEKRKESKSDLSNLENEIILIAGSEGNGIKLNTDGQSIEINHDNKLESLNVGHALAIVMEKTYLRQQ